VQQILVTNVCPSPHVWCVILRVCADEWTQLPWSTANEDLVELFETTGHVQQAEIMYEGNRSKGMGIVQFEQIDEAETAIGASAPAPAPIPSVPLPSYRCLSIRCSLFCSQVHELHVRRPTPWCTIQPCVAQLQPQRREGWCCVNNINRPTNRPKKSSRLLATLNMRGGSHSAIVQCPQSPPIDHRLRIYALPIFVRSVAAMVHHCDLQNSPPSTSPFRSPYLQK
jgi:hypothetical protein